MDDEKLERIRALREAALNRLVEDPNESRTCISILAKTIDMAISILETRNFKVDDLLRVLYGGAKAFVREVDSAMGEISDSTIDELNKLKKDFEEGMLN